MAVRIDSAADQIRRTATLPAITGGYTMCGWANQIADRNNFSSLCELSIAATRTNGQLCLQTNANGQSFNLWYDSASISVQEPATGFACSVGVPFFWAAVIEGTSANQVKAYFRNRGSNAFDTAFSGTTGLGAFYTPTQLNFGNASTNEWWSGDVWNCKVWERALTAKELLIESFYERVMFPTSLWAHYLLRTATDDLDYSGNARPMTMANVSLGFPAGNYGIWRPRRQIFVPQVSAGGGPQLIDVVQISETDSVLALTRAKSKAVGLNTETDTAQAVTANRLKVAGLASETDSAQAVTFTKSKAVGLNTETDTAQAVTANRPIAAGLTTETDSAQAIAHTKTRSVGLNTETDTAFAATAQRSYPAGLTTETDAAQAVTFTKAKAVGLALETDEATAVGTGDTFPVGLAAETDSAFGVSAIKVRAVGLASSSDTAQALARAKARTAGLADETDAALAVSRSRQVQVGLAADQAEAFAVSFFKLHGIGLAIELDSALPIEAPDRPLDPSAYFPVSVQAQSPQAFQVVGEGPSHAKLFNV